ncbi:MAG TPA: hypothetical protein VL177_16375 [Terriglobales bacterium]|nr:hypothetical protein [Terriglobales bacterium]
MSDPEGETEPVQLDEFDPWLWRLRFLDVNAGDRDCLLQFLNEIGCYATLGPATGKSPVIAIRARDGRHVYGYEPRPLEHEEFLDLQQFCRDWPCHLEEPAETSFESRPLLLHGSPALVITTASFEEALQAAFIADQLNRAKPRRCARPDCGKRFPPKSARQKYCARPCAHLVAVQNSRKRGRAARKGKHS